MTNTYVTNLQDFLDIDGEIITDMPVEARQMASFLALVVDEASRRRSAIAAETSLRCKADDCHGQVLGSLRKPDEVIWECRVCGMNGVIRNWKDTKWDQSQADTSHSQ